MSDHSNDITIHGYDDPETTDFLTKLREMAEDWRYSDEFIGIVVRAHWPKKYEGYVEAHRG